jgi:hypothetical protein
LKVTASDNKAKTELILGTDYKIKSYVPNAKNKKATLTIEGLGDYAGTKTVTLTLTARDAKAVQAGQMVSELTSDKNFNEKTVYLAYTFTTNDEFTTTRPYTGYAQTPELKIYAATGEALKNAEANSDAMSVIKSAGKLLTQGVDYTIKFTNNTKVSVTEDGKALDNNIKQAIATVTTKGGYKGTVKFTDVFGIYDVSLDDFEIAVDAVTYSGKAVKPTIRFFYTKTGTEMQLKAGTAYTVTYKNNTKTGVKTDITDIADITKATTPYVVIKEKDMHAYKQVEVQASAGDEAADETEEAGPKYEYVKTTSSDKDSQTVGFTITTGTITAADVSEINGQTYNGKAVQPNVTVKVNGRTLKANTDYVVTYTNNKGAGKATATITGIGSYSGTVQKKFVIK